MSVRDPGRAGGRRAARRRGVGPRRGAAIAIGVVVALVVVVLVWRWGGDEPSDVVTPSPTQGAGRAALMTLSVVGGADAYVAVIGAGGGYAPAAVVLEPQLTLVAPGQGDRTIEALAQGDGAALRAAVSNGIGAWTSRYGVMDVQGLGAVVERQGTINVNLPDAYPLGDAVLGPGEVEIDATDLVALLTEPGDDAVLRFLAVMEGVLASGASIQRTAFVDSDDAGGAAAIVATARSATVDLAPTEIVAGTVLVPSQPDFDDMMGQLFGTSAPVRTIIQNGSGQPGVGVTVAERLLPAGFRVVISENADTFDHPTTVITANGAEHEAAALRAQEALGVGTVEVSDVGSGFADVTIVVGKDFTA